MALSYIFSVSYKKGCYRHIKISSEATLLTLHRAIAAAFGLADGRMHVFFMNNCAWDNTEGYYCTGYADNKKPATDEVRICDFKIEKDRPFIYIYDFRNEQRFSVKLLRTSEEETRKPQLIRSCGEFFMTDRHVKDLSYETPRQKETPVPDDKESLIHMFASAAANLYGFVSLNTFCKIFGKLTDIHLDLDEARTFLANHSGSEYELYNDFVMFPAGCETPALLDTLLGFAHGKPRFVPESRDSFLKYLDIYYMDSPEVLEKIRSFFVGIAQNSFEAQQITNDFIQMLKLDYPINEFNELISAYGITSIPDEESYLNLIIEAKNASRLWKNKGFTPPEAARLKSGAPIILKKIGRNDPCPCGSGKKYKKCCGK